MQTTAIPNNKLIAISINCNIYFTKWIILLYVKYKILIVDDEESGRKKLQILLQKLFWAYIENISLAKDYKSASEKLIKEKFDIVFLDINLNGKSSFDLIAQIPQQPKIIFVTAYSEFMLQALREKAFDYLVKPVKEDELKKKGISLMSFKKRNYALWKD